MHDLIIIGSGPAGLTAGLYAGRFRLSTLILERMSVGGQIILSSVIENFPGFPGGISTQDLIEKFKNQVNEVGVEIKNEEVLEIIPSFKLKTTLYNVRTEGGSYETKTIIVATGASPKKLGIDGEERLVGRGVSYCGTCDGPLFRDKDIVVVGGGDRAIEEVIFLASYARKVTLVHRRQELRASKILEEKARSNPKIDFVLDTVLEQITGENKVAGVKLKNVKNNLPSSVACQGVFIFVGIIPNTHFLKNLLQVDEAGFIITDQNRKTSCEGIFACGDCTKKSLYQVVNACGEAAVAADAAHKYLMNL